MNSKDWKSKGDDVATYPYAVVYQDRATFPPCDYFKTEGEAYEATNARPAAYLQERKMDGKREVARVIWKEAR